MPSLYTDIEIRAPRRLVWQTLIRKEEWLRWNTYLYDLSPPQPLRENTAVRLSLRRAPRETETEIEPLVTLVQPGTSLQWIYSAPGFRSEHSFDLQDMGGDRTRYTHVVRFTGRLVTFFLPFVREDELQGMRRMAQELRRYVERR
ncbi:SRPBCC domain-containing protein [Vacuolonema iberomarrocanum]|uniref:SRPBCC domain-containing protein n=1 Tax=Vacuolonema iberomarrocanum TaxID=3454632 RepID=UPI001A0E9441|nr:SRPBCC domain-containing protein [filamentous cyanobacterium LEGE 07170]